MRRQLSQYVIETYGLSERQACVLLQISRTVFRYQAKPTDETDLQADLLALAERKRRWGVQKMMDYFRNQGKTWNHKRVRRVYRALGLKLRVKPKKRLPSRNPQALEAPVSPQVSWSLDFMHDSLANGRPLRTLNILDDFNREGRWIEVAPSLPAARVVRVLDMLAQWHGYPAQLRIDNGPELISQTLADWAEEHRVQLAFIQPGKPAQNAFIERFNRSYREEILDAYLFDSVTEAQALTEAWLEEYNAIRPHEALGGVPPYQYQPEKT